MRIFEVLLAQVIIVVPIPESQLDMKLGCVILVGSVSSTEIVENIEGVNVKPDVKRNFRVVDSQFDFVGLYITDIINKRLVHSSNETDVRSVFFVAEEKFKLIDHFFGSHDEDIVYFLELFLGDKFLFISYVFHPLFYCEVW